MSKRSSKPFAGKSAIRLFSQIIVKSFRLQVFPNAPPGSRCENRRAVRPKIMTILRKEKHLLTLAQELGAIRFLCIHSLVTRKLMEKAEKKIFR